MPATARYTPPRRFSYIFRPRWHIAGLLATTYGFGLRHESRLYLLVSAVTAFFSFVIGGFLLLGDGALLPTILGG